MSIASLRLFGCVDYGDPQTSDFKFLAEYGVLVLPTALHCLEEIETWLQQDRLTGNQLNSSFHKSWDKVRSAPSFQLWAEQILHYLSTYGMASINLYSDDRIYIPEEVLDLPEPVVCQVIRGIARETLLEKALSLLSSGVALEQATIEDILSVLDELNYQWTGKEEIKNREAMAIIADKTGVLPVNPDALFRYLIYKATGQTLVIKNDDLMEQLTCSGYTLPRFSKEQLTGLAQSFNRYKPLWLALKQASKQNAGAVNRIAKLSKVYHKPQLVNVLGSLTAQTFEVDELKGAIAKANVYQLIRAVNAVRYYQTENDSRFYRVRSGKGWTAKSAAKVDPQILSKYEGELIAALKARMKPIKVFCPAHIDYALPVSEKQFSGAIPKGTRVSIPQSESHMLCGVYWEGGRVDLDLRADAIGNSVGWNVGLRSRDRGLMHSGDVTSAPNGATEFLYAQSIDDIYAVKLNDYYGGKDCEFRIILGYGDNISSNYVIDPGKVLFQAPAKMIQREMLLGLLVPRENGVEFYLVDQGSGQARIGHSGERGEIAKQSFFAQFTTLLRLRDLVAVVQPELADVDLSPEKLGKDSILSLFNS